MHYKTRRLLALGAILALVASGAAAFAATGSDAGAKSNGPTTLMGTVTSYLGLSAKQIAAQLATGKTLAQITAAQGKSVAGLEQTIEQTVKSRLDQGVAAGAITSQQEQKVLSGLHSRLDTLVGRTHPLAALRKSLRTQGLVGVVTSYLGVTVPQLVLQLEAGKTLAQIATAHGKTAAGLEQAITTAAKTRLDKAVAAGYLKAATEQKLLTLLSSHLDQLVNHSFAH